VDATVTKLTNFGAFARVQGDGGAVEGLIHISELSSRMVNHPKEVLGEGDEVKVKILRIEADRRRLGLSLKQAEEEYGAEIGFDPEMSAQEAEGSQGAEAEEVQGAEESQEAEAEEVQGAEESQEAEEDGDKKS